jgi:DNA (cytosine-5)-methyltransferase 3A
MLKFKNVISCFDGASCAQMSLKRAGFSYQNYYAIEIDENAKKVTTKNFPNTIHLGDITKIEDSEIPKSDIVFAGSPCKNLSNAGLRNGMTTTDGIVVSTLQQYTKLKKQGKKFTESCLFWEFIRIWKLSGAKYFFFENTRMNKMYLYLITKELGVEPILINSSLVSAQNRERYYWTNLPGFIMPKDRGIMFNDIVPGAVSSGIRGVKRKGISGYVQNYTKRKDGKANCLVTKPHNTCLVDIKGRVRKITVEEGEKLQTWPKGYLNVKGLSDTSKYEILGNGWTTDVVAHFLKCAKKYKK